jgi:hypothetical protein
MDAEVANDERHLARTAKSCGPDIPTLMSNWRRCFRIMASDGDTKPGLRGEHEGNRKTIRAGKAGSIRSNLW